MELYSETVGVGLELITDQQMYLTIETSLRCSAAVLGTPRYAKANNTSMPQGDYDPNAQISILQYFFILMVCTLPL